ncbi:MAG: HAD-IA family hydrolase [Pseudomonadota bacterium]
MKHPFDLIIFDWDGTLINSIDWIVSSLQWAAQTCSYDPPSNRASRDVIGLALHDALGALFPEAGPEAKKQLTHKYAEHFNSRRLSRGDLFEGIHGMLVTLKEANYRLALATGKSRAGLEKALKETDLVGLFDATRCADETASKPNPKMLFQLMSELDAQKNRTLMVGDSVHDIMMAKNANVASIGVTCGAHDRHTLSHYTPMACLSNTADLLEILNQARE